MTKPTTSKFVAAAVGFTLALTVFVGVGATTAAAQAMSLSDLVNLFISLGIISPDKADAARAAVSSSTTTSGYTYTRDLTIGSTGADVTALQTALGVTPTSGYFGNITKAAVASYQASKGLPSTGYFGPLTRAEINKTSTVVTTPGTTTTTPVVNTGVEGTLTVNKSSVPNTTAYEGDTMRTVLAIKAEAKLSDIALQRVKLQLGTASSIYTKIYRTLYLVDDTGKVLAQADLNSNTVVKNGGIYEITLGGFTYVVPNNSTRILSVKADLYSSIDSDDRTSRTITVPVDGLRGVDGAGIDQYAPGTGGSFSQQMSINSSLIESAALKLSTNSANYKTADVVASEGTNDDELDKLGLLSFDLKAEKDEVTVTDIVVTLTNSGSGAATTTTLYLMDGSSVIDSETVVNNSVTFDDIDYTIGKDVTKNLVVRADIRDANATKATVSAAVAASGITAENSQGDDVDANGSASGENMNVRSAGILAELLNTSISKTTNTNADTSTTTASVVFSVRLTALGDAILFGTQSASTTFAFVTYDNDASSALQVASSTSFAQPTGGDVVTTGLNSGVSFKLNEGGSVEIPVTFTFVNRVTSSGALLDVSHNYKVGLDNVKWATETAPASVQTTDFMSGRTEWRSASVF